MFQMRMETHMKVPIMNWYVPLNIQALTMDQRIRFVEIVQNYQLLSIICSNV